MEIPKLNGSVTLKGRSMGLMAGRLIGRLTNMCYPFCILPLSCLHPSGILPVCFRRERELHEHMIWKPCFLGVMHTYIYIYIYIYYIYILTCQGGLKRRKYMRGIQQVSMYMISVWA